MIPVNDDQSDQQFDLLLARVLQTGVLASAAVVSCGALIYLARHGGQQPAYHAFVGEPGDLRSVGGSILEAVALSGRGLIQCGLLLLIATPLARVMFSLIGFLRARDWLYVGITLVVLVLLTYSLATG